MDTSFGRTEFRKRWLTSINELTDFQLQVDSWIDLNNTNPHWSFGEFVCCYFDEILADEPYDHYVSIGWISLEESQVVREWHNALDQYKSPNNNDFDHRAILSDPTWIGLTIAGAIVKEQLTHLLKRNEVLLLQKIDYQSTYRK